MPRKPNFKRRPNNSGTVVKLSGKRRKPYCAKITAGYDIITGRQKQISIGTYETWQEADDALSLYRLTNKQTITDKEASSIAPDLFEEVMKRRSKNMLTFNEIFEIIYNEELCKLSKSAKIGYVSWNKHFKSIHNTPINMISLQDLQDIFDHDKSGHGTKTHMKVLCSKIFEYAVIHQYISRDSDYTEYIKCGQIKESTKHYAFSIEEIKTLMNDNSSTAKIILIYIFTGLRANELLNIPRNNIHMNEPCPYLITGSKTKAGKDRLVPIHPYVYSFIKELVLCDEKRIIDTTYQIFKVKIFDTKMAELKMKHTIHDARDTFATLCQLNNVDIFARKRILGHKMKDITFDTYTTTVIENLYNEILKIKAPGS